MLNPLYDENEFSCQLITLVSNFVRGRVGITEEKVSEWVEDFMVLAEKGEYFFNLNRYVFKATKPDNPR